MPVPDDLGGCGELGPDLLLHAEGELDPRSARRARIHLEVCAACREWLAAHDALTRSLLERFDSRSPRERRRSVERILSGVRALSAADLHGPAMPIEAPGPVTVRASAGSRWIGAFRAAVLASAAGIAVAVIFLHSPAGRGPGEAFVSRASPPPAVREDEADGVEVRREIAAALESPSSRADRREIPGGIRWLIGSVRESDSLLDRPSRDETIRLMGLHPSRAGAPGVPARFVEAVRGTRPGHERCFIIPAERSSPGEPIEIVPRMWFDAEREPGPELVGSRECRIVVVRDGDPFGPAIRVFTLEDEAGPESEKGGYVPGWIGAPRARRILPPWSLPAAPVTLEP